ncbi:hypothetical protein [Pontibacter sp. H249]|uniref:hypothetical protein n=1 Tax=Pontibacter sp. H249 TaxID=3133420 RepID=UPI0030BC5F2E
MKTNYKNWLKAPSLKHVIIITTVWAVGLLLLLLAITDFFQTSPFVKKNMVMGFLILTSTATTVEVYINYLRNRKRKTS